MSDLMLLGILRMPLDDTPEGLGVIAWTQIKSVMREAANRIEADAARIAELEAVFETKWDAEQRAIKAWQEKTGKNMTWPDHAKMVEWLLDELDAARAAYLGEKE
jgi:hypothetical protein